MRGSSVANKRSTKAASVRVGKTVGASYKGKNAKKSRSSSTAKKLTR